MIAQNEVDGWSDDEEQQFQILLAKRMKLRRGTAGHDVKFAADMLKGEKGERAIVEAFQTGEIKTIYEVSRNGKIFVEHENYGKPSGLCTTDADWWIFLLDGKRYKGEVFVGIKTERLKKLVEPMDFDPLCGSHKASLGKRVNLPDFLLPDYRIYELPAVTG